MLSLSKLILLFCSVHLGLAARCGFWDSLVSEARCDSLVKEYKVYVRNEDSEVIHEHAAKLCSNALSCLSSYNCDEINYKRIDLTAHCEISIYASYENEQCLRGFFRKAYASQFSSKQTCFKEFQFVDKDRAEQREAFIEGRTCFFDYLEEYCSSASTDGMDSLTYFQNNYEQFVESMTHEPAVDGCTGPRDLLNVIYCSALSDELDERSDKLEEINQRFNRRYLDNTLRVCKDAKECIDNSCILRKNHKLRREYSRKCSRLEFQN